MHMVTTYQISTRIGIIGWMSGRNGTRIRYGIERLRRKGYVDYFRALSAEI